MVRFGVLSATFWSIGVDLVAGAVFKEVCWVSKFAVSYGLAGEFLDENTGFLWLGRRIPRRKYWFPMAWKANSSTKIMGAWAWI